MSSLGTRSLARRPLWSLLIAGLCVTCHASADRPEPALAAGGESALARAPRGLDVERARALHPEARALIDGGEGDAALAALEGVTGEEAAWLRARAHALREDEPARLAALRDVVAAHGALAPWARLELALAVPSEAAALLAPVASLDWPGAAEARLALALGALEAGDPAPLRAVVAAAPDELRGRRALADHLAESDDDALREEALAHYRAVDAVRPGRELEARIDTVLASLRPARREALAEASVAERLARAEAIAATHRHEDGEAAFAAIVRSTRGEASLHAERCQAELGVGRGRYRRRARREAIETLDGMADRCRDVADAGAWGRYFAAKSFANLDERHESVARWDLLATEYPGHRLADDAHVEAARMLLRMGDVENARERLRAAIALGGDMRGEARFLMAWTLMRPSSAPERDAEADLAAALAELEASLAEGTGESAEDVRGRAAYWRGYLLGTHTLGDPAARMRAYAELANADPLSFYGQLARDQVVQFEGGTELVPLVEGELSLAPDVAEGTTLDRIMALLRVGEHARATTELTALGALSDDASTDTLWWVAALYDRSGAHHRAVELARRRLQPWLATQARDPRFSALVDIAYPRAYGELITGAAEGEGIPPSLVFAIAREESSFEPRAASGAHAYGMLQIIRSTARPIAERLGLPSDVRALSRPDVSVRIGARYLGDLSRRYEGSDPRVVPAAYNAGHGAVDRWLRTTDERTVEAFIEEIPYAETRRYTRRVLMSQGIYQWRTRGSFPTWPLVGLGRRAEVPDVALDDAVDG